MQNFKLFGIITFLGLFLFCSCLTVEKKEYTFTLTSKDKGELKIKYINIMSIKDDSVDVSDQDFEELINNYIQGDDILKEYPDTKVKNKRIFEENGVLCGEVILEFNNLDACHLYKYDKKSPYMFHFKSLDNEGYLSSNGNFGGENMPVVFWNKKQKVLQVTSYITKPDNTTISLLHYYKNWQSK